MNKFRQKTSKTNSKKYLAFAVALLLIICFSSAYSYATEYVYNEISVNQQQAVEIGADSVVYFKFVPSVTAKYTFSAVSDFDTFGFLYDADMNELLKDDDSGEGYNFSITSILEKDNTYYWAAKFLNASTVGSVNVSLVCASEASVCGHENAKTIEGRAATCTKNGYTESIYCDDCSVWITESEVIPATNHSCAYTVEGYSATCTQEGLTDGIYCDECSSWIKPQETIEKTSHDFLLIKNKEATCTVAGEKVYLCSCTATYTEAFAATGHSYVLTFQTKATFSNDGKKIYTCEKCGDINEEITENMLSLADVEDLSVLSYSSSSIKISWNKVAGATEYIVSYKKDGSAATAVTTENLSITLTDLSPSTVYYFTVKAVNKNNEGAFSLQISQSTKPESVSFKSASPSNKSILLKWNKTNSAEGYQILYSEKSDFSDYKSKVISDPSSASATISSLSPGTVYYIKIRAYTSFSGKKIYGSFSSIQKTTTLPSSPTLKVKASGTKTITVSWNKVSGATGYQIIYSTSSAFTSFSSLSFTSSEAQTSISGLSPSTAYYIKIRAYKTVASVNYYSDYSSAVQKTTAPVKVSWNGSVKGTKSIELKWNNTANISGYQIVCSPSKSFSSKQVINVSGASTNSRTVSSLAPATCYYFKIRAFKTVGDSVTYGEYSEIKRVTTKPEKVSWSSSKVGEGKIVITWKEVTGADGYQITYSTSSSFKSYKKVNISKSTSLKKTLKNLKVGTTYYIRIRAYKIVDSAKVYGNYSTVIKKTTELAKVTLKSTTVTTSKIVVKWNKVKDCSGYEVVYSTLSNFSDKKTITVKGEASLKKTIKKLSSCQSYYIKVRAYKTVNKTRVYGDFSKAYKRTTLPEAVTISKAESLKQKASLSWKKLTGVSGYQIAYSPNADFSASKVITVSGGSKASRNVKELTSGKIYYFKIRAYKTVDGKQIYGQYGPVVSLRIK